MVTQRHFVRRGGGEVWVELHDVLVRNPMGETTGIRTAMLDISERKRAEDDLLRRTQELTGLNAELERESAERRKVEDELRTREYSLSESQRIAHVGSWSWELPMGTTLSAWTPETYRVFGVPDNFC